MTSVHRPSRSDGSKRSTYSTWALLVSGALLAGAAGIAQAQPKGPPGDKGKPAPSASPTATAAASVAATAGPSANPSANPSAGPSASAAADAPKGPEKAKERKERGKKDRDELRKKVQDKLKNQPMAKAMKEELERHARRVARITRVKEVAVTEKDDDAQKRADELLKKENARHDKWMANYDAKADKAGAK